MTYQTPCSKGDIDPNDWFIGRDGKQYSDEPLEGFSPDDVAKAWLAEEETLGRELTDEEEQRISARLFGDALKAMLQRRRHAREACYSCYFRTDCLDKALATELTPATHGTWGGYYEEELRELRREISRRKR